MPLPRLLWLALDDEIPETAIQGIEAAFETVRVTGLPAAADALRAGDIDCVLASGSHAECSSVDALEFLRGADSSTPIVVTHPEMRAAEAVKLIRCGAYDCVDSSEAGESIKRSLEKACKESRNRRSSDRRQTGSGKQDPWFIGESRMMQDVFDTIRLIGPRKCTVLITGETGTGKEMAAKAVHAASPRGHLAMVAVNCSALPENLLEAELFGHVKGAFTGATANRVGRFEQANRSTLFLDEIGEMPLDLQAKLLRVLQEREIQRLGSSETIKVDVRVVAATNVDLAEKVRRGEFRQDLYFRLNVVPLRLPALRDRRSDVPLLVDHLVRKICHSEGLPLKQVSAEAKDRLSRQDWPGNVRELENAVEMAVALSGDQEVLYPTDFGLKPGNLRAALDVEEMPFRIPESMDFEAAVGHFQRTILQQALAKTNGNKTAAAEILGMKRTTLIMKLRVLQGNVTPMPLAV